MTVQAVSPAKVNLFLAVGPSDSIGYHPIRTVFQAISLADQITIEPTQGNEDHIESNWSDLPAENTLTKSLRLLRELVPVPPLKITLEKNIPSEAGLGGGSSNAAALLRAVDRFLKNSIEPYVLHDVAAAVGADVPFFLVGGLAQATGYGEKLTPLPDHTPLHFLIVKPSESVSTACAYRDLDAKPFEWRNFPTDPLDPRSLYNDFERVAPCVCGEISDRLLTHGAFSALLSGSGSAVFGLFPDEMTARNAQIRIDAENLGQTFVCHSLDRAESLWTTS